MLHILRAFAWMRWRVFINSLEKTGARDAVERFSLAIEHIAPILVLMVMIPSALALAGLSGYAGYQLTVEDGSRLPFQIIRYLLLGATIFTVVGPIVMPVADRTNPVRFLLLPIPAQVLYAAQTAGAITDPWILAAIPIVAGVPVGLLAGGAPGTALAALLVGLLFFGALLGLSALTTTVIHLVVRDRRRGELVALLLIFVAPLAALIPASLDSGDRSTRRRARTEAVDGQRPAETRKSPVPVWVADAGGRVFGVMPSELYARTIRARQDGRAPFVPVLLLAATAVALHSIGIALFKRVMSSSGTTGARRSAAPSGLWSATLPGVSPGTSAVALSLWRLALRTPRGRSILLSPILMLGVFGFLVFKSGSFNFGPFAGGGLTLATFLAGVALLAILPITMNQFAVDGAGLTTTLLSPLSTRQLLAGKAIGGALIVLPPALVCVVVTAVLFGRGEIAGWLSIPIGLVATYILASPAAAIFSALLPRVVDMNSIGRGSNAHGLSGFLGLVGIGLASLPSIGLALAATKLLQRPGLAPVLLLVWCAIALAIARVLFALAERIFETRRENLAMLM